MAERIAILGAGALGGTIGAYLLRDGYDVTLIDQWGAHVEAIKNEGLSLTDVKGTFTVAANALHISEVCNIFDPFDIIIMCLKAYDVRWSTYLVEPILKPTGIVLLAQNGMGDLCVASIIGHHRTVGCVVTMAAGLYEPGHIHRTDPMTAHNFTVGELSGVMTPRVKVIAKLLESVGLSSATTNIWGARWAKLAVNCMGNTISGLINRDDHSMTADQEDILQSIQVVLASEAVRVGLAMGIPVEPVRGVPAEALAKINSRTEMQRIKDEVARQTKKRQPVPTKMPDVGAPRRTSLLQDVIKGRRTEVDFLNGYVVEKGTEIDMDTPMNRAVLELMRKQERGDGQSAERTLAFLGKLCNLTGA